MKQSQCFHSIVLITLSMITLNSFTMKPEPIPGLGYRSRQVTIVNKLEELVLVVYPVPDHGFDGPSVLRSRQVMIESGKDVPLLIVQNKNGTVSIDIRDKHKILLSSKVIPKESASFDIEK